jgi:hypothetical protein
MACQIIADAAKMYSKQQECSAEIINDAIKRTLEDAGLTAVE